MMNSETTIFESQSAMAGTSLLFCAAKSRGMFCDLPAANSTSAQISVQARNAPNTEISTPIEIRTAPQCPTASSKAPAGDGFATPEIATRAHRIGKQRDRDHEAGDVGEAENGRGAHVRAARGVAGART